MSIAGGLAKSRGLLRFQARSSESPERARLAGVKEASNSAELFGRTDVQAQPSLDEGVSGEGMIFQLDDARALSDVHSQGLRALSCPMEILVDGSGQPGVDGVHGSHGVPGKDGADGAPGKPGYGPSRPGKPGWDGKDGKPGMAGKKGFKGGNGTSGGRGANFHVELSSSDSYSVQVAGFMELPATPVLQTLDPDQPQNTETMSTPGGFLRHSLQLQRPSSGDSRVNGPVEATEDKPGHVSLEPGRCIVIRASGGRGGRGGNGGNGGNGGRGGSGGSGGQGGDGKKGLKPGMNGENGGDGGAGGNGVPGGAGGDGGPAGKGGNAGAGGRVVVQTTDPTLLMLVEVDVRPGLPGEAGIPGIGGTGGESGKAGAPGPPGKGGPGWDKLYLKKSRKTKHFTCHSGTHGRPGKMGAAGSPPALMGSPGLPADAGKEARPGQVTWIVKSHDGEVLERGKDRYNCVVTHFRVQSSFKDGVIRPGGEVLIDQVEVCNSGGITLPGGTRLFFQETAVLFSVDKNSIETLPAIRPHKTHKIKRVFRMRVIELASPVGGSCFNATTAVVPCVDLLGRPFRSSDKLLEIPLRYPVQIVGDAEFPHTVRKGDVVVAKVRLRNISTGVYGSSSNMSLGPVKVMVLMFVELEDGRRVECSWTKDAEYIAPSEDCILGISCRINNDTLAYSLTSIQVHLLLGGQSVEYRHLESRVVPVYEKAKEAVFITDSQLKPKEYVAWKYVLAILGLEHVCWDVTWHCTFAPSEVAWLGGHNLVILPHVPQDHGLLHWIRMVLPWHVHTLSGPASAENAGAVVMGPYPKDVSRHMINWESLATTKVVKTSRFRVSCFGDTEDRAARRAATQALHFQDQLNALNQNQYNFVVSPSMKRGSALVKLRAYREILPAMFRLRAAPIEAVAIPSGFFPESSTEVKEEVSEDVFGFERWSPELGRSKTERPATQHLWSPIPLWSPFGFAISAMLVYLPIKFKLRVLAHFHSHPPGQLPLYFTSNVSFIQVIGLGLYYDVKMDWYSRRDSLPHGELLVAEIERLVSSGQWSGWSLTQDYVYALTGGLIHFRSELSSRLLSGRSSKAKTTVNALIERVQAAICRGEMKFPTEKQIKQVYDGLTVLPPWLFVDATEKPPIQIVYE